MALGEVAVNADVLIPDDGARVPAGRVELRGHAFAGGSRHVARVDVSIDGGQRWLEAELLDDLGRWRDDVCPDPSGGAPASTDLTDRPAQRR